MRRSPTRAGRPPFFGFVLGLLLAGATAVAVVEPWPVRAGGIFGATCLWLATLGGYQHLRGRR